VTPVVRRRRPEDLQTLVTLLAEQQPVTAYPLRWPLPFPVEQFLVRPDELAAWVVELDGVVTGHVSVAVPDAELGPLLADLAGTDRLALVAVLFVGLGAGGQGLGGLLLDTAVAFIRESGRVPVLDVVPEHDRAVGLYRSRGWHEIGRLRPAWLPEDRAALLVMTAERL
jgi:GNAT superfamily N-acetyltransferase